MVLVLLGMLLQVLVLTEKIWPGIPPFPVMGGFIWVLSVTIESVTGSEVLWCGGESVVLPLTTDVILGQYPYHRW